MSQSDRCPRCGAELTPDAPLGLCPACLLKVGLAAADSLPGEAGSATSSSPNDDEGFPTDPAQEVPVGRSGEDVGAAPAHVGPYTVLGVLGEGGMGIVYLAEQTTPIHRRVALKVIKPGMDSREVLKRFDAERQALSLMDHPHIARVLDAGLGPGGRPYFVMEYVPGLTITDYCDRHRLSNTERLALFLPICAAVQHAHQKGVIHRDLKPSNILVTMADGKPVPKVIDFGVAKATHQQVAERAAFTELGRLIGTPEYMSPEQAEASGLEIDTTTDIYALGVVLYELLVGALPFDPEELRRAGYSRALRLVQKASSMRPIVGILTTLGIAQYRTGAYRDAVATLEKCTGLRKEPDPADLAVIAMAWQKLGDTSAALRALEQLRAEMKKPGNAADIDEEFQPFLREAEAVVGSAGKAGGPNTGRKRAPPPAS